MMRLLLALVALMAISSATAEEVRARAGGTTELLGLQAKFNPVIFHPGWVSREAKGGWRPQSDGSRKWTISTKDESTVCMSGSTDWKVESENSLKVTYRFRGKEAFPCLGMAVVGSLPNEVYAGETMIVNGRTITIPLEFKKPSVYTGTATNIVVRGKKGAFTIAFAEPTAILLQDNRQWQGKNFSLRMFLSKKADIAANYSKDLDFNIVFDSKVNCETSAYTITANKEWIPIEECFAVESGSALDFTDMAGTGKPAGKYGYPIVKNGHFEFEKLPGKAQRFYGVNFVASANFPEEKYAKPFAEMLARTGYNAVRMHHHDQGLTNGADGTLDEDAVRRFDTFIAALIENGLYVTTDFFVSRKVPYRDCGIDKDGVAVMGEFKRLVLIHEGSYQNFIRHARALLSHVNPHTGRRYADEPALGWISFINEGTLGAGDESWFQKHSAIVLPKWKAWLAAKRATDSAYAAIPETLPKNPRDLWKGDFAHKNAYLLFLSDLEREFARRTTKFLREEMKCRALTTNMNYSFKSAGHLKVINDEYDYMDDHFYVDHPRFLEQRWKLPSEIPNANTFLRKTCGAMWPTTRRILDKPFVITEYNYSGPGRYRGVGGIATGAMAALQDWDGLWRFAWSHGDMGIKGPKSMTYFDMSGDPLGLASERASMCLFLRRDVEPYNNTYGYFIDSNAADTMAVKQAESPTEWRAAGWWAKVGCVFGTSKPATSKIVGEATKSISATEPVKPASLKRPIRVNPEVGSFTIETQRTVGGFAEGGEIEAEGFKAELSSTATVWASSLDGKPIKSSSRILVTHLTDVQNSGITYADSSCRVLMKWGEMPHLMRVGSAKVALSVSKGKWQVYSLSPSGRRRVVIPCEYKDGILKFIANVARDTSVADYIYEVTKESK